MVKITDPLGEFEETVEERKNRQEELEKEFTTKTNLSLDVEEKKVNKTIRLPESLLNTLQVYCNLNNVSINSVIEDYLINKFKNKKIIKERYQIEETTILIPKDVNVIHQFIENEVNLIVNVNETTSGIQINQFDKHNSIYYQDPSMFQLLQIKNTNNYLDYKAPNSDYYYSNFMLNYDLDTELTDLLLEDDIDLRKHLGLIALQHQEVIEPNINFKSYKKLDVEEDKITADTTNYRYITIFLLVKEFNNKIVEVNIITPDSALKYAKEVNNEPIIEFINNNLDVANINDLKTDYTNLQKYIEHLEEMNHKLVEDYTKSIEEIQYLRTEYEKLQLEKVTPAEEVTTPAPNISLEEIKELSDNLESNNKNLQAYITFINKKFVEDSDTLRKIENYLEKMNSNENNE